MFLRIEKGSAVPISSQIEKQIAMLCAAGKLKPGEKLPSVRELARELAVNQNTVLRVYDRLVREQLLEMRQGQGTFVSTNSRAATLASHRRRLLEELRQWAQQGISMGLETEEMHQILDEALAELGASAAQSAEAEP